MSDNVSSNNNAPLLPSLGKPDQEIINAILMWMVGFLLSLQAKHYLPDASIDIFIKFLYVFITITGCFSDFMKQLANVFPRSLESLLHSAK